MKKILSLLMILLITILLSGCVNSTDTIKQIDKPIIKTVQDNIVYWGSVEGAESYVVNIDDIFEKKTDDLSYDLNDVLKESKNGFIKVKAKGNNITTKDSDWSEPYEYKFIKKESTDVQQPKWNSENCYIGYTFNVLNNGEIKTENLLMNYKLIKDYNVINTKGVPLGSGVTSSISYITNFSKYKESLAINLDLQDTANFPIYCVDVGISTKFNYSSFSNEENNINHYLVLFEIMSKNFQFSSSLNYEDTITKLWEKTSDGQYKYLYEEFVDSLLNDEPEVFFSKYGTHIVCSYNAGGYAYASFVGDSLETLAEKQYDVSAGLNVSAGFGPYGGHSEYFLNLKKDNMSNHGQSNIEIEFDALGGDGAYISNPSKLFEGESETAIQSWLASINKPNEYMPEYSNAAMLLDKGLTLKPLWEFILDNDERKNDLEEYYNNVMKTKQIDFENKNYFDFEINMGDGTKNNPYLIITLEDLEKVRNHLNDKNVYFKLCADIDITSELGEKSWIPIGDKAWNRGALPENSFQGHFDGNGKTIKYSIYLDEEYKNLEYVYSYGLFGSLENAKISNLNIVVNIETIDKVSNEEWDIDGEDCPFSPIAGGIAGWMKNCEIINCNIEGIISLDFQGYYDAWYGNHRGNTKVGGMAGFAEKTHFTGGSVKGEYYSRGFHASCGKVVGSAYNHCNVAVVTGAVNKCLANSGWLFGSANGDGWASDIPGEDIGHVDSNYNL